MILDNKNHVKTYKGESFKDKDKSYTMKDLALNAIEKSNIEDPRMAEIAGLAMEKIYSDSEINQEEIQVVKRIMMNVYHPIILGYISKQFDNGDINTER